MNKKIELLAPAGSSEALHAAVENGADAVYLGGRLFNARQQASNFDMAELKGEMEYAHVRGVNIYLTMNTLVSDDEMKQALHFAAEAREAGIDGIIVQDLGLAGALYRIMPDVPLHGSTQMTVYDLAGVRALEGMGFRRVVLAREVTLREASEIAACTPLEVEVFVHGALCICYSGQCLMSSIIGGRSGNRGRCAQPCRLPYRLSGGKQAGDEAQFLLSPKDMCSLEHIGEIAASGIRSLKIEGRMKSAEYVATVVRIYRKYLDMALAGKLPARDGNGNDLAAVEEDMHDLLQIFNRGGFSSGYMKGKTGRDMMCFEKPNHSGIYLGSVKAYDPAAQTVSLRLEDSLSVGDGVELWAGRSDSPGGVVSSLSKRDAGGQTIKTAAKGEVVAMGRFKGNIRPGHKVYKTTDVQLNRSARESFSGKSMKRIKIKGYAELKAGMPLMLKVQDERFAVSEEGTVLPEAAIHRPLTEERLIDQLSRTGSTPFDFEELRIELENGLSLPVSEINEVRRRALDNLLGLRAKRYGGSRSSEGIVARIDGELRRIQAVSVSGAAEPAAGPAISLYFYRWEPDTDYSGLGADRLYLPVTALERTGFREQLQAVKAAGTEVFAWLPAITKGRHERLLDDKLFDRYGEYGLDGVLAGNIGTLRRIKAASAAGPRLAGDISLNLFNALSVNEAVKMGLESAALSAELTLRQISHLIKAIEPDRKPVIETAVYGRLPLMISEYCPAGCVEGGLNASAKCSGCCSKGDYKLQDRMGMEFPVICDRLDCRSTILNSNVLFVPDSLYSLKEAGTDIFRLYIWDEPYETVKELVKLHRAAAAVKGPVPEVFEGLVSGIKANGFTKGHYYRGV